MFDGFLIFSLMCSFDLVIFSFYSGYGLFVLSLIVGWNHSQEKQRKIRIGLNLLDQN